ncbi:DUF2293 domain-containing protein [Myxococcota bacterium]|nr:DUF2293 domain-containing protein [Myxococcota bacterium]
MSESIVTSPTSDPRVVVGPKGERITIPAGWDVLPPGDAGLTRRVKAAGPSIQVIELRGRKRFSRGLWAPAENIRAAKAGLDEDRADPAHARALEAARARRAKAESQYKIDFANSILTFLRFSPRWHPLAKRLAVAVAEHATPVGSGTVARTKRIPIDERAESALIAWMRHQTTAYDDMTIPRVKGMRREVRRMLAERSRQVLARHRTDAEHDARACALCKVWIEAPTAAE